MRTILILLSIVIQIVRTEGQDIHFVNHDIGKMLLNPSYAGKNDKDLMAGMLYRDQWTEMGKLYRTYSLAGEMLLPARSSTSGNLAVGLWIDRDNAGLVRLSTNQVGLSVAYHALLNQTNKFSGGIYVGLLNQHLDESNMQWGSQYNGVYYDASLPSNENLGTQSFTRPDVGAGLSYMFNNRKQKGEGVMVQGGFSMYHLNKPDMSYTASGTDHLHVRKVFHISSMVDIPQSIVTLSPSVLYMLQGSSQELCLSFRGIVDITKSNLKGGNIQKLWAGFHYRNRDAVIAEIGIQSHDVAVTFSYDWTVSGLKAKGVGAFELGVRFVGKVFKTSGSRLL